MTRPLRSGGEDFIPNAQIEQHFKLVAPLPEHLTLENFPADLPSDFDHQVLDLMGLKEQCCLLYEPQNLGWRVTSIRSLVEIVCL